MCLFEIRAFELVRDIFYNDGICNTTPSLISQGFFEGIRATRGGAGGPGAPRPAVGAGALAMDTMDDDDAAGGVS